MQDCYFSAIPYHSQPTIKIKKNGPCKKNTSTPSITIDKGVERPKRFSALLKPLADIKKITQQGNTL
jgi:hypothetical protein